MEYLNIIDRSGNRMLNLINDLIDISRIESGEIEMYFEQIQLNDLIREAYNFFKPEVVNKGMSLLESNSLSEKNICLYTDREKLFAVISNLIKNAIKYSHEGEIEIGCEQEGDNILFFVRDTGIGIAKERQKEIFDRFNRADQRVAQSYEGSGLGLAISKAYIEMMGGQIWLESETRKGSVFYFRIPFIQAEENGRKISGDSSDDHSIEPSISSLSVLIVDDDETSRVYLEDIFQAMEAHVITADNGKRALEIMRENVNIDLIMMDVKMPEMDGYEATQKIREFNKDVLIIAQTAYAIRGEDEKAVCAGCNAYLSKPVSKNLLLSKLRKLVVNK
jgi:hypothetical protein